MHKHKRKILAHNKVCTVKKCACGIFNVSYRFVTMNLSEKGFLRIVQSCFDWSNKCSNWSLKKPYHLFVNGINIHISAKDFSQFSYAVQKAAINEIQILDFLYGDIIHSKKYKIEENLDFNNQNIN